MSVEKFDVLSPVGAPSVKRLPSAPRVADLDGKTICEVSNGMFQADTVLSTFGELIKERYPTARVIPWTELPVSSILGNIEKSSKELSDAYRQKGCDAVIASTGA